MRRFPFHPFLFAVAPVLFLYAHNVGKLSLSPAELAVPALASLGLALALWFVLFATLRSWRKAAVATSLFLILFYAYGHVTAAFGSKSNPHLCLVPAWAALFVLGAVLLARSRGAASGLTAILNFVSLALVAANLALSLPAVLRQKTSGPTRGAGIAESAFPDIYYIILDGYARSDVLEHVYRLDNSDFIAYLRNRGFRVASLSRSNYSQTYLSLASSLNMTYLDSVAQKAGPESDNRSPLLRLIASNRVMAELRRRGYKVVSCASGYTGTNFEDADVHYSPRWALSEFQNVLISTTPLPLFLDRILGRSQYDLHRDRILYAFERLPDAAGLKPPVFVFCHILAPHPPFVFGANGEKRTPKGFFTLTEGGTFRAVDKEQVRRDYIRGYRDQLAFITTKTRQTIDLILARSAQPPVIIIQADHGPGSILNWDDPAAAEVQERMSILNACLVPGDSSNFPWHDSISPVNTFRLVFNRLFGDSLPLLKDRSWFSTIARPYRFFDADRPEEYAARVGKQPALAIVAFRMADTPEPDNPGLYARRLVNLAYPGQTRSVAAFYLRRVRAKPEGISTESAVRMYKDAVAAGEIPDLGSAYESYAGIGPDRESVTALYFPVTRDSAR